MVFVIDLFITTEHATSPELVNTPFRLVAEAADLALGTVAKCMHDLTVRGLLRDQQGERTTADRQALVALWILAYIDALRPGLKERRFQVRADDKPQLWPSFKPCSPSGSSDGP